MAFDVLISGRLAKPAESRIARNDSAYALASVIVPTEGDETLLASCICFSKSGVDALLALDKGDAVSLAGKARINTWTGSDGATKVGLNVAVDGVMTVYHVRRKRDAVSEPAHSEAPTHAPGRDRAVARLPARQARIGGQLPIVEEGATIDTLANDDPFGDR